MIFITGYSLLKTKQKNTIYLKDFRGVHLSINVIKKKIEQNYSIFLMYSLYSKENNEFNFLPLEARPKNNSGHDRHKII